MVDYCPTCGLPIEPKTLIAGKLKKRIMEYVSQHPGCSGEEIALSIYADDPNGGPDCATESISVMINQMNKYLANDNLFIGRRTGRFGYSLLKIKEEQ